MVSVVTPHRNDLKGIENIYDSLRNQTTPNWELIVVDDFSDSDIQEKLRMFSETILDSRVKIFFNEVKTNPAYCRNKGVQHAGYSNLVFLDSDDTITAKFIENRTVPVQEFIVYKNFHIINDNKKTALFSPIEDDFLAHFLQAKFSWQTTAILWNKAFFVKIGKFNEELILLEDIELSIRALVQGTNYKVLLDNELDFYYYVKSINIEKRNVEKVCDSVKDFVVILIRNSNFEIAQIHQLISYYYLCIRYLHRSGNRKESRFAKQVAEVFYKGKIMTWKAYCIALGLLFCYENGWIGKELFIRTNRYFFK